MNVNFIGIGAIGLPMALQIQRAGHDVTGMDVMPTACDNARALGVKAVSSLAELPRASICVVMVATPMQLEQLVDSMADRPGAAGACWIVMSTVGPTSIRAQGERLQRAGVKVIDAPVTGGVARAKIGQLVIFAAGHPAEMDAARPVLQAMGEVRNTGANLGDGQAVKVVNQHLCSVHLVAAAEALNLAKSLGLDPQQVLSMVEKGAASSWMLSDRGPRMLGGTDVEVTSAIDIFVKDSGLVVQSASECGAAVPLLNIAHTRFSDARAVGLGKRDDSRVIETWH